MRRLALTTALLAAVLFDPALAGGPLRERAASRSRLALRAPRAAPGCDPGRRRQSGTSASGRARSRAIGYAWRGRLEGGVLLRESAHVRYLGEYREGGHHYGTRRLVGLIERAAERVHQRLPGARLSVGELSSERGGSLVGHRSHENGRDADLAFYMTDARGNPYEPFAFAAFGADGVGQGPNRMLRFDDARNWELVARLVSDGDARVQHIFVSNAIKRRLLRVGRGRGAPASVLGRVEQVMVQPSHGHPHANHFHVRVYCNPHERSRCRDREPFHAWYPGTPPERDRSEGRAAPAPP